MPKPTCALPGGAIDPNEPPADAGVRECFEETGLLVRPDRLIGVFGGPEFLIRYPNGDLTYYTAIAFEAAIIGGALKADGDEIATLRFIDKAEWEAKTAYIALIRAGSPKCKKRLCHKRSLYVRPHTPSCQFACNPHKNMGWRMGEDVRRKVGFGWPIGNYLMRDGNFKLRFSKQTRMAQRPWG
jgi:ADP-ribose pyrophosphatase YjhB (NUDIX family)